MSCTIYDEPTFGLSVKYSPRPRRSVEAEDRAEDIYESAEDDANRSQNGVVPLAQEPVHKDKFQMVFVGLGLFCLVLVFIMGFRLYYTVLENETSQTKGESHTTIKELCPDGWMRIKCECYFVSDEKGNWTESREDCEKRGGHLAVIDTKERQNNVSRLGTEEDLWIGLRAVNETAQWAWVDGSALSYSFWAKDVKMTAVPKGAVAFMTKGGLWNYTTDGSKHWLCQKEI